MPLFSPQQPIRVADTPVPTDREYAGYSGRFIEYTKPHGYALIDLEIGKRVLLHPESLEAQS